MTFGVATDYLGLFTSCLNKFTSQQLITGLEKDDFKPVKDESCCLIDQGEFSNFLELVSERHLYRIFIRTFLPQVQKYFFLFFENTDYCTYWKNILLRLRLILLQRNALNLSVPAIDVLLKSRSANWFQLSGHPDTLTPAGHGTVWKKRADPNDETERIVYEELSKNPLLASIIPKYYREVDFRGEKYIELQDLLHGFEDPFVIDIKMGTRTFLESEVKNTKARPDLYQKMIAIDPNAPTEEEHLQKAVTKLRYMQFREQQSSSSSLGFRIEAIKCPGSPPVTDLKKVKSIDEIQETLKLFLRGKDGVKLRLIQKLCKTRNIIDESEFFKTREVIGSSLFIIYDDNREGVWLIDFAKTHKVPDGLLVDHKSAWSQGNHEEGLLFGMNKLICILKNL
ncbi:inositol-trisphosphate 3-kinase homolog [Coccinella septempunctata]|uniref:inositol-trisphosphate 3-kinase homolog n=1 Tax=Coccinella septempunctata TaxID=41139 RepID=UPI001D089B8F|nr:inositol-trisphosphate 3-kinase homolog [Coccinella septempunctata]